MSDDHVAVQNVVSRFFLAMDRFEWQEIASLIDDEISLVAGQYVAGSRDAKPRDQFMAELVERNGGFSLPESGSFHGDFGHVVTIDGDTAHVQAHFYGSHWVGAGAEDEFHSLGMYEIDLTRRPMGWRIRQLEITSLRNDGASPAAIMEAALESWKASGRPLSD